MDYRISIILPTYNEGENIVHLIDDILTNTNREKLIPEIIVVDDNSPDGTSKLVKDVFGEKVTLILRKDERGLASAIKTGILNASGEIILIMDTDFNHDPSYIPLLIRKCANNDIVIGSRYMKGGGMEGARIRFIGSYFFNLFTRLALGISVKDAQSGFLAVKKEVFRVLDLDRIFYGYGDYCIRLLYYATQKGLKITEIPVVYRKRVHGESKTNLRRHLIMYTRSVIQLKVGTLRK